MAVQGTARARDSLPFDNVGVASAALWLWSCFTKLEKKVRSGDPRWSLDEQRLAEFGDIWVLLVRPLPAKDEPPEDPEGRGLAAAVLGPLKTLLNTRTSSQVSRNRRELEALRMLLAERPLDDKLHVVELRPLPPEESRREDEPFSLSWHLTQKQIERNGEEWARLVASGALEELDEGFGE